MVQMYGISSSFFSDLLIEVDDQTEGFFLEEMTTQEI